MKKNLTLLVILILGFHYTKAQSNVGVPCADLFFSEYIEGTGQNKAIEIFNPTTSTVNLTGYQLLVSFSTATNPCSSTQIFNLSGSLNAGDVYVICKPVSTSPDPAILAVRDTVWNGINWNGNDAIYLINPSNDTIDMFGKMCNNPGTCWYITANDSTRDMTLIRNSTVHNGQINWALASTEWTSLPLNTFSNLGSHTFSPCTPPLPTISFNAATYSVNENGGFITCQINITNPNNSVPTNATVTVTGGTAINSTDYTYASPQSYTFSITSTSPITFNIPIFNDLITEPTEDIVLTLSTTSNANIGSVASTTINILDDDYLQPTIMFNTISSSVNESVTTIGIAAKILGFSQMTFTADAVIKSATAISNFDYNYNNQSLFFDPINGINMDTIYISFVDDCLNEGAENVVLALRNPSFGAAIGTDSIHTITINDNDALPTINFTNLTPTVNENVASGFYTLRINIANSNCDTSLVQLNLVGGNAIAGVDYTGSYPKNIMFPPNYVGFINDTIYIINDNVVETLDSLMFTLTNVINGTLGTPVFKKIYINDDDTVAVPIVPTVSFVSTNQTIAENLAGTVNAGIAIINPNSTAITVNFTVSGTCSNTTDYTILASPKNINANTSSDFIPITVIDDNLVESSETIIVTLNSATNANLGTNTQFTLNITDNDVDGIFAINKSNNYIVPSINKLNGNFKINTNSNTGTIKLYNNLGILVEEKEFNTNSIHFENITKSGIYYYEIKSNNTTLRGKLIILE